MFGSTPLWPVVTLAGNIPSSLVSEVFKDGSQLNRGAGCDALGIEALLQVPANPTDGELQIGLDGPGNRLGPQATALFSSDIHLSLLFLSFAPWKM